MHGSVAAVWPGCAASSLLNRIQKGVHNGEYISKAEEIADGLRSEVHEAGLATTLRKQADGRINLRRPRTGTAHRMESTRLCAWSLRVLRVGGSVGGGPLRACGCELARVLARAKNGGGGGGGADRLHLVKIQRLEL